MYLFSQQIENIFSLVEKGREGSLKEGKDEGEGRKALDLYSGQKATLLTTCHSNIGAGTSEMLSKCCLQNWPLREFFHLKKNKI